MRILMAASEMAPLARTGGLADVLEALPAELQRRGHEVSVILPYYRSIRDNKSLHIEPTGVMMTVEVGARKIETEILEAHAPNDVQVFFVRRDEYFDRSEIYGSDGKAYEDNAERFIFFSKAAVELARRVIPAPLQLRRQCLKHVRKPAGPGQGSHFRCGHKDSHPRSMTGRQWTREEK